MGLSGCEYSFLFAEIFDYESSRFSILFDCHAVSKITYGPFFLYCCFQGWYKSRNIGILTQRCAKQVLSATPRYAAQCEVHAKNFLVDSVLCCIVWSHLNLQISLWMRNLMQKWFNSLISDRSGIDLWKTRGLKISWDCSFNGSKKDAEFYADLKNITYMVKNAPQKNYLT
jgi:hypothetical protein